MMTGSHAETTAPKIPEQRIANIDEAWEQLDSSLAEVAKATGGDAALALAEAREVLAQLRAQTKPA